VIADGAYVAQLRALLASPDLWRSVREVRVESLRPVDDGPWPELEVSFGLVLPDDARYRDVPRSGTLRLPFAREWRELSRYADPAAYAPEIASAVESAAADLVGQVLRRASSSTATPYARSCPLAMSCGASSCTSWLHPAGCGRSRPDGWR
jgi:hypothetical protein